MPLEDCGCESILNNNCADSPVQIETVECSSNEICHSTNWTKCIKYDGPTLGCASTVGKVNAFTFTGSGADAGVYTATGLAATGGTGTGATFNVSGNALNTNYAIVANNVGTGYKVGDVLTIAGNLIQGSFTAPANNAVITITSLTDPIIVTSSLITKNQTLSTILANLNARICALTPEGLDYSGFDYSCLRVGGNLESTGDNIETAEEFTEATADALCNLNTRLKVVETPEVEPGCITSITGGETLLEVLDAMIEEICVIKEFQQLPIAVTAGCFSTVPSSSVDISAWFQWIVTNTCSIKTSLETSITTQTNRINAINTYLHGSNTPSYPITYDNSCFGGSGTATVHTTLNNLITEICAINTTLSGFPNFSSIVLSWASCFSGSPYSYSNAGASLQTQLERILNVISREKISFSSDFTVTDGSCGKTVELAGAASFNCSMLSSCSIGNLGDVDVSTGLTIGKKLYWNGTAFVPVADDSFEHLGTQNKSGSYASLNVGFNFYPLNPSSYPKEYKTVFVERSWTPVASYGVGYNTPWSSHTLQVKRTWENDLKFKGQVFSNSPATNFYNLPGGVIVGTLPVNFFPSRSVNLSVNAVFSSFSPSEAPLILPCNLQINTSGVMTLTSNIQISAVDMNAYITSGSDLINPNYLHSILFEGVSIFE